MDIIAIALVRLFDLLSWVIIIKSFMTWFPGATQSKIYDMMCVLTDPIEDPIRNVMYRYMNGPVDFTPLVAILALNLAQMAVIGILL